jgi:hypothetical protein
MRGNHLEEKLYEYVTGRLSREDSLLAEEHLGQCEKCQREGEEMKKTLELLDQVEPPPLSREFKRKVIQEIYDAPLPSTPLLQRMRGWFRMPAFRWSFEGVAVACAVLLTITLYRGFTPQTPATPEAQTEIRGGPEFALPQAKSPVVVETKDLDKALADLGALIQSHDGKLVRRRKIDTGLEVTMDIRNDKESSFLQGLSRIGKVEIKDKDYRDTEGNIVVRLLLGRS